MKEVGLLIDLYQSPTQDESVFKHVVSDFFNPLIKIIKSFKSIKVSLNIPLSTLELLDKYDYQSVIKDIRDLYENDRVEIVGSAAYNPLLTETHSKIVENEIILNEYALGSYFGAKQGFEGEPSIMIKDIDGFLPTGLAVNKSVLDTLGELKYEWVLVDNRFVSNPPDQNSNFIYKYPNDIKIVVPNNEIGELVNSFNTKEFDEIWAALCARRNNFGNKIVLIINNDLYHVQEEVGSDFYKKKISVIDQLVENFCKENISITSVRDITKNLYSEEVLQLEDKKQSQEEWKYDSYYYSDSNLSELFKSLDKEIENVITRDSDNNTYEDLHTVSMWKNEELGSITDINIYNKVCFSILMYKYMSLDKYVYSLMANGTLSNADYSKNEIRKYVTLVKELVKYRSDEAFTNAVLPLIDNINLLVD